MASTGRQDPARGERTTQKHARRCRMGERTSAVGERVTCSAAPAFRDACGCTRGRSASGPPAFAPFSGGAARVARAEVCLGARRAAGRRARSGAGDRRFLRSSRCRGPIESPSSGSRMARGSRPVAVSLGRGRSTLPAIEPLPRIDRGPSSRWRMARVFDVRRVAEALRGRRRLRGPAVVFDLGETRRRAVMTAYCT